MSVVIIGGGERARQAISDLESASLVMDQTQRDDAETFLNQFSSCIKTFCDGGAALPAIPGP